MRTGLPGKRTAPQHVVVDSQPAQPSSGGGGGGSVTQGTTPWVSSDATAQATLAAIQGLLAGTITTSDTSTHGTLTAIQGLLAGTLAVVGAVAVSNFPATQPVSAAALPLPAGASTEATLALIKAKTDNIDVALSTRTKPGDTQPVSAASLPLPSGASTETTLAGIKTGTDKIPASPSAEHTTAASPHAARLTDGATFYKPTTPSDTQPVSIASMPSTPVTNANLDVALSTRALEAGGNLAAARTDLDNIATRTPSLGPAAGAGSVPVVLASDQVAFPTTDAANGTPGATAPAKAEAAAGVDAAGLLRALAAELLGGSYALKVGDESGLAAAGRLQATLEDIRISQAMLAGRMI